MNRSFLPALVSVAVGMALPEYALSATTVSVPPFRSVELRGGGHIVLRRGPEQRVTVVEGSTEFARLHIKDEGRLVIDACNQHCPHRYNLEVEIVTPRIEGVAIEGGGKIETEPRFGRQGTVDAAIEGGGHIDIRSIDADHADAAVSGGGNIDLRAERSLEAAVDGGGNILYWGNPSVTSAVNGGGNVGKGG
ncbi:MAG: DUF2807 domain-containing protein [Alphaproteobacteria bacterium]|nr:DUF2807 domain-containing protein [Alphaproteobacteria bacterium]MBV9062002.1 DUF2807 domain-containing protein [Alphaproteobacteria bacterium]